jgi:hypothetical protein
MTRCGCNHSCGDLPFEQDSPWACCKGLPREPAHNQDSALSGQLRAVVSDQQHVIEPVWLEVDPDEWHRAREGQAEVEPLLWEGDQA